MSVYGLPRTRMYWSKECRVGKIAETMTGKRWEKIKADIHFCDNSQQQNSEDKLFKIRYLIDKLNENYNNVPMGEMLCVDEQIIPFKGRHTLKQYMPVKPKKWGYKAFVLCDSTGIIYNFGLYTGKTEHLNLPDVGVCGNVVLRLTSIVPRGKNFKLFCDNWFTSVGLLLVLENYGISYLGTVQPNRLKGCDFISDKALKEKGRGSFEEKHAKLQDTALTAVKWFDNKSVHLISTFTDAYPLQQVSRYCNKQNRKVKVDCPMIVKKYISLWEGLTS